MVLKLYLFELPKLNIMKKIIFCSLALMGFLSIHAQEEDGQITKVEIVKDKRTTTRSYPCYIAMGVQRNVKVYAYQGAFLAK